MGDVKLFALDGTEIKKEVYHVTWDIAAAEKGGYDYFMMKEIMEQPEVLNKTIQPRLTETDIKLDEISLTEEEITDFCMDLPRYKRPHKFIFADVPRNPTGKIEKPKLRKMYGADNLVAKENMA